MSAECPAMPGVPRCPEWLCDCFIEQHPESPLELHPEAFVVGPTLCEGCGRELDSFACRIRHLHLDTSWAKGDH